MPTSPEPTRILLIINKEYFLTKYPDLPKKVEIP